MTDAPIYAPMPADARSVATRYEFKLNALLGRAFEEVLELDRRTGADRTNDALSLLSELGAMTTAKLILLLEARYLHIAAGDVLGFAMVDHRARVDANLVEYRRQLAGGTVVQ